MKRFQKFKLPLLMVLGSLVGNAYSQIKIQKDYSNNFSPSIGTFQGIKFREAGFSGLFPIPNTNGKEFWTLGDRGANVDCASANAATCRPTYDKMFSFPTYAPKIHRVRVQGDSVQILQTISIKRPGGTGATGVLNPTGFGSTATELISTDTVNNCANFTIKTFAKDVWALDCEGIVVDKDGNFWVCEENGPTIWKIGSNGIVINRYTPYANLSGAQTEDLAIDTCFKYRKNNRGFENIAVSPSGKIYALIQSPLLYPTSAVGSASRVHRILEIDPVTNQQKMYAYLNDGIIGAAGANQIRLQDWKLGDMAAINDTTFLVLEAAARGTSDIKKMYKISLNGASVVKSGLSYSGKSLEGLVDSLGFALSGIVPVKKTLVMDLLANGWPSIYDKAEGLAIINDSTIAICNDNDFGQTCPKADGIPIVTTTTSHIVVFDLKGKNKLVNFIPNSQLLVAGKTGPSTSASPYLLAASSGVSFTSILTANESIKGYKMTGVPDGMGAYDNNDGTFTMVLNHEISNVSSIVRSHGNIGSFISKWIINKSDLSVASGSDLIKDVYLWTPTGYILSNSASPNSKAAFTRFCSADLPLSTAFYNPISGLGTKEKMFLNGEESGAEGRAFAHILTGTSAGTSYELPLMGKYSFETAVANPNVSNKTIVAGNDDATPGQVYMYVGVKQSNGSDIDKAGLTNGSLYGISVSGLTTEISTSFPSAGTKFSMINLGNIKDSTGAMLNTLSNAKAVTNFLRPEDGTWDPYNPSDYYFVTTNAFASPSRLWRLRFTDINNPENGGTISALLDGTEGQKMLDNLTIDNSGHILLQEDVGGNIHNGKIWQYTISTDKLDLIAKHDPNRFETGGSNFLTIDEESSGIIDVQSILGSGQFLLCDQAHYAIPGEVVEGGQILSVFVPETFVNNPEILISGNSAEILMGDTTATVLDNTDFGASSVTSNVTKSFVIKNTGVGNLSISKIEIVGLDASSFSILSTPNFPIVIGPNSIYTYTVRFTPKNVGSKKAIVVVNSNDYNELRYDFVITGLGFSAGSTGPSTTKSPYLIGTSTGVTFTSLFTAGDVVGDYTMVGIPDGLGAFDNNDGTFTVIMNHELGATVGASRAHGSQGAFISRWNINKSNLSILSGEDQIKNVYLWENNSYKQYNKSNATAKSVFTRFCSGDLALPSAFYNTKTGKGSKSRIYLNGEESGAEGRAFAHVITGLENGNTYELPYLGKFSWENAVANPFEQDKTIVAGNDDATPGQVYVYVGEKSKNGSDVEKAGLTKGKLFGIAVSGLLTETSLSIPSDNTAFSMVDLGDVKDSTGFQLNRFSTDKGVTTFLRPEDGVWDQNNASDYYFVTTNSITAPSRLWKLHFTDIQNPEKGGTISALLSGTEGQKMMDNLTSDNSGHLLLQEDVGNNVHNGKIHQYTIESDKLLTLAQHDPSRFETNGSNFLTLDEESSGIIDVQSILGPGMFLLVDQAHYAIAGEVVEGGQLLTMFNPTTFNMNPELVLLGKGLDIINGTLNANINNGTDFGNCGLSDTLKGSFTIKNVGKGDLIIKSIDIDNTAEYRLTSSLPMIIAPNSSNVLNFELTPKMIGKANALVAINTNDIDESQFQFALSGNVLGSKITVDFGGKAILNQDLSPETGNGTDFGRVVLGKVKSQIFTIKNVGLSSLEIKNIKVTGSALFSLDKINFPISISKNSNIEVRVNYQGNKPNIDFCNMTLVSNSVQDSVYEFAISAESVAPQLAVIGNTNPVNSGSMNASRFNNTDFGLVGLGYLKTVVFQLENFGKDYLLMDSVSITGLNKGNFKVLYPSITKFVIAPGKTENLIIEFATEKMGAHNAVVTLNSNNYQYPKYMFGITAEGTVPSLVNDILENSVNIFPVPANEILNIHTNDGVIQSVIIFNCAGTVVDNIDKQLLLDVDHVNVKTGNLPDGIYFAEIMTSGKCIRKKFVITH